MIFVFWLETVLSESSGLVEWFGAEGSWVEGVWLVNLGRKGCGFHWEL